MAPVSGSLKVIALDVMISLGLMTGAELEQRVDVMHPRPSLPESDTSTAADVYLLMQSVPSTIKGADIRKF